MTAPKRRLPLLAALGTLAAVLLWEMNAISEPTSANWTDGEQVGGHFKANVLQSPKLKDCGATGLLPPLNLVYTRAYVKFVPQDGYLPGQTRWTVGTSKSNMTAFTPSSPISGPDSQGFFTATFGYSLLQTVLGGRFYVGAQTHLIAGQSGLWTSDAKYTSFESTILGLNGDCKENVIPPG